MLIRITDTVTLDENEIKLDFIRSSGPGGQNVNKVSTAVQLRFDVLNSPSLPPDIKIRLLRLSGKRLTKHGILVIKANRLRSQEQNRKEAVLRLIGLIRETARKKKIRHQTAPGKAAKKRRLDSKSRHSKLKRMRRSVDPSHE